MIRMMDNLSVRLTDARRRRAAAGAENAFTLVEILVVIALTGLLLALIIGPLIQGFRLTNRARALAAAQDATRFGLESLKRELSQAAYVYDNANTPIVLPLDRIVGGVPSRAGTYGNFYPGGNPIQQVSYAKIDFVPAATLGEGPGTVIDPTTDKPLGGTTLQVPISPGRRIIRYFIGLQKNRDASGNAAVYQNVYEFPRTDNDTNTFVLYRAEFDPSDPNLIDQTASAFQPGGLQDPNFFYNTNKATTTNARNVAGNGFTYAENWKAVSSPVLNTTNLDVIAWRRDSQRQIVQGNPYQLQVAFSPGTVLSDTATPGFLSSAAAESPTAVPSLYTAKYGQWTFPFSVTIFRGGTEFNPGTSRASRPAPFNFEPFGSIKFTFEQFIQPNLVTVLNVRCVGAQASLSATPTDPASTAVPDYYWLQDPASGKIYVFTAGVAFSVDPSRGRVDTALPPIATQNGVPLYRPAAGGTIGPLAAGVNGNQGTLVETVFRQNTRDDDATPNPDADFGENGNYVGRAAGQQIPDPSNPTAPIIFIPKNQGIGATTLGLAAYFDATPPLPSNPSPPYVSPFEAFGNANQGTPRPYMGLTVVPGSDKVLGPDNNLSLDNTGNSVLMVTYYRVPATASISKFAALIGDDANPDHLYQWTGQMNYQLITDLDYFVDPILKFDERPSKKETDAAGLPARTLGDARPQGELRVTYLWQNNYARDPLGRPVNPQGEPTTSQDFTPLNQAAGQVTRGVARPEADVFKLDYNTRSLLNVTIGARVYDISTGQPQTAQVGDKVTVGNIGR